MLVVKYVTAVVRRKTKQSWAHGPLTPEAEGAVSSAATAPTRNATTAVATFPPVGAGEAPAANPTKRPARIVSARSQIISMLV
jgi:hypothetical protein